MTKKVALVVAAGSGIGRDAAIKLNEVGYDVGVMSSSGKGADLAESIGGYGFTGSILIPKDIEEFTNGAIKYFGRIDGVVNCTGHGPKGPIVEISDKDWYLGLDYYLLNVVRMTRTVVPMMKRQGFGSIVNISTFSAFEPDPEFPTSAVYRAGLAAYTKLFCDEHASSGIRMNNVLPGFIDSLPEKIDRKQRIPAGRYGKVRELSEVITFLISDAASYINGQNIRVDGGLTHSV